jgi:FKBP-type peptidyl-prolyl cis-trans isomerase
MMSRYLFVVAMVALSGGLFGQAPSTLTTEKEKLSYALGASIGDQMRSQSVDVDPDLCARGLKDALSGGKMLLTDVEVRQIVTAFQNELRKKQIALQNQRTQELAAKNKTEGEAFLAQNKSAEGVVTLPSGLQYKILKEGVGEKPKLTDTVVCHYRGTLIDGTEFDSSYKRNEPATFAVGGVIKGWTEALQLMPVGSKWQLFVPSSLGYGERGAGRQIGPNAVLIFEVELISIK